MNLRPVGKKLIVKPGKLVEAELPSGIVIPASAMADLREGEVAAVSDEIKHLYPVGTGILFHSNKGVGQMIDGEGYLWLDSRHELEEIWGVIEPTTKKDKQDSL